MSLREAEVQAAFVRWLEVQGWIVKPFERDQWLDVYAERGGEVLLAEVKGRTTEPGIDSDIAYGQLLRRMPATDDPNVGFALVIPDWDRAIRAVLRVPPRVRATLRIEVFAVSEAGSVRRLHG